MAFLAVFREGFETAVFLLAAFQETANPVTAGAGALLGLAVAVVLGYGIYRGGVSINLSKFFRFTGAVLVLVAAGLVVNALHTAHEAGWLTVGQGPTFNLSWLVQPGSVRSSLLTGMLGWQPQPVVIELVGWLAYLIPVGLYVAWPPGRSVSRRLVLRASGCGGRGRRRGRCRVDRPRRRPRLQPSRPTRRVALNGSGTDGQVLQYHRVSRDSSVLVVTTAGAVPTQTWTLRSTGTTVARRRDDADVPSHAPWSPTRRPESRPRPRSPVWRRWPAVGFRSGSARRPNARRSRSTYRTSSALRITLDARDRADPERELHPDDSGLGHAVHRGDDGVDGDERQAGHVRRRGRAVP